MPVGGAASEECAEPKFVAFGFVDVDGAEIAGSAGGDVETEAVLNFDF